MSSPVISFPAADRLQWQKIVTDSLKGLALNDLHRIDEDGLDIAALYQVELETEQSTDWVPVTRLTANPRQRLAYGWDVCQPIEGDATPTVVNRTILNELEGGANGIYLTVSSSQKNYLKQILRNVVFGAVDIVLDSGNDVLDILAAFQSYVRYHNKQLGDIRLDLAIDPFAPDANSEIINGGLALLQQSNTSQIPDGVFRVNGWNWHNIGISQVWELAYVLAAATQIFRVGIQTGLSAAQIAQKTTFSIALPADMFDGIAKCRAARRCWAGLVTALGLDANRYRLRLQAIPSIRMFSLVDGDANILRTTTALLGGAIGGADMMTAFAHDTLQGGSPKGRRLARMQQLMMIEEAGLSRSIDSAGGAAFIEARTASLAEAAWSVFQEIEADGGAAVAQAGQRFHKVAKDAAKARYQRLLKGELPLLGVTVQSDFHPVPDLSPRWQNLRRPAAVVETIRRHVERTPPRILILQQEENANEILEKIRCLLKVGAMTAVHLMISSENIDAVTAASPVAVVLLDIKVDELDPLLLSQLNQSIMPGAIFEAEDVLKSDMQIDWLARLVDMKNGEV